MTSSRRAGAVPQGKHICVARIGAAHGTSGEVRLWPFTGDPEAVSKVLSAYRVYAKKVPLKDGDYTMDHTALIYLMDREGHFVSPFSLKRTPEEAAKDLKRYL